MLTTRYATGTLFAQALLRTHREVPVFKSALWILIVSMAAGLASPSPAHAYTILSTVSAGPNGPFNQGPSISQTVTTDVAGREISAIGLNVVTGNGCTQPINDDNRAVALATAVTDFGVSRLMASAELDSAFTNPGRDGVTCTNSSTGITTIANAGSRYTDDLFIAGPTDFVSVVVRGTFHATSQNLNASNFGIHTNFRTAITISGQTLFSLSELSPEARAMFGSGDRELDLPFEAALTLAVGQELPLSVSFGATVRSMGTIGIGSSMIGVLNAMSTLSLSEFYLPAGYSLSSASGQIASYGDYFGYVAVHGQPSDPAQTVPEPKTLSTALLALALMSVALKLRPRR